MESLAFLIGTWRGSGHEQYPTVDDADYEEELRFTNAGEAFVTYVQRAWAAFDGTTLHAESGFWRLAESGTLEVCLGHPLGVVEVSEGTVNGTSIVLRSRTIARAATGEPVAGVERRYEIDGDTMRYEIAMALDHVPLTHHLSATLRRAQ
jgi:hypothetical protein